MIGKLPHSVSLPYPGSMAYDERDRPSKCSTRSTIVPATTPASHGSDGTLELRALHYDNRGDPTAQKNERIAWDTHFNVAGAALRTGRALDADRRSCSTV